MIYKWLIFNSVTVFVIAYLWQYYDAINWVLNNDHTHISLIIAGVYALVSAYIGYKVFRGKSVDGSITSYASQTVLALGLIGTVAGLKMVFGGINFTDTASAIVTIMTGLATAQTATLFGLSSAVLISFQKFFVTGKADV